MRRKLNKDFDEHLGLTFGSSLGQNIIHSGTLYTQNIGKVVFENPEEQLVSLLHAVCTAGIQ